MTKDELIQKLNAIQAIQNKGKDIEADHSEADELLLEYINDERVTEAFEKIEKWYA